MFSSEKKKNTNGLIENAIAEEKAGQIGIFYLNTKNEAVAKVAERVQFPNQPTKAAASSEIILHQVSERVNLRVQDQTQTRQFARWFGDWQNNPSRASKIVNEDGSPEILKLYVEEMYNPNESKTSKRAYKLNYIEQQQPSVGGSSNNVTLASSQATAANVHTVSDLFALVKRRDKKFSPKAASQIVNEDGSPKIMYHQTDADFSVFRTESTGAGRGDAILPDGAFFKYSDTDIGVADALTDTLNKSDSFLNQTCFFNVRYTVRYMVEKLAAPPSRLEIGSARKTPLTPSPAKCGRRSVSGMTTMPFRKMEKKMA